jgi:hypothetical protein
MPQADRIMIDTGDGAALCFSGDPEDALLAASAIRSRLVEQAYPGLNVRIGVNLGPVIVVKDINQRMNAIGDGINVAQRIMSFAQANQVLVSRSYFEVVSRLADDYAKIFHYHGLHKDKHIREHEVYELTFGEAPARPNDVGAGDEAAASGATAEAGHVAERFDPDQLKRIEKLLAQQQGPLAKLMLSKAARRARDLRELAQALADTIPDASRKAAFLADALALQPASGTPDRPADGTQPEAHARTAAATGPVAHAWDPGILDAAERRLAGYVGPLAKVLVRRAAGKCVNAESLYRELAMSIDAATDRDRFLAECGLAR